MTFEDWMAKYSRRPRSMSQENWLKIVALLKSAYQAGVEEGKKLNDAVMKEMNKPLSSAEQDEE